MSSGKWSVMLLLICFALTGTAGEFQIYKDGRASAVVVAKDRSTQRWGKVLFSFVNFCRQVK